MTTESGYNGWSNYPTWNVKLWMDNDEYLCNELLPSMTREAWTDSAEGRLYPSQTREEDAVGLLADRLESFCDDPENGLAPELTGFAADLFGFAFGQIDWREIAASLLDDLSADERKELDGEDSNVGADGEPIL